MAAAAMAPFLGNKRRQELVQEQHTSSSGALFWRLVYIHAKHTQPSNKSTPYTESRTRELRTR